MSYLKRKYPCPTGTRYHKPTGDCKVPCAKTHGPSHRRSPKSPYRCIAKKKSKSKSKKSKSKK